MLDDRTVAEFTILFDYRYDKYGYKYMGIALFLVLADKYQYIEDIIKTITIGTTNENITKPLLWTELEQAIDYYLDFNKEES